MISNLKISVIISTINRPVSIKETITSLSMGISFPDEMIIVDQSNNNNTELEIHKWKKNLPFEIKYNHIDEHSLTYARNIGIKQAENEIIIFMDDDVTLEYETIANVRSKMSIPTIALIGAIDLNSIYKSSYWGYLFLHNSFQSRRKGIISKGIYGRYPIRQNTKVATDWAMGFFFVIRKSLVQKWSIYWDERLIKYGYPEDLDFSYRYCKEAKKSGMDCILDPSIAVYHRISNEWRESSRTITMMEIINREYLTYKWNLGPYSRLCTRWANIGTFLQRCLNRNHPFDVLKAQYYCDKFRNDIRAGNLHTELYEK